MDTFHIVAKNNTYYVNGVANGTLLLKRNQIYTFEIDSPNHYFYFTSNGNKNGLLTEPIEYGTIELEITDKIPPLFYYRSTDNMSIGVVKIVDDGIKIELIEKFTNLNAPVFLTFAPGELNKIYIVEQRGIIYKVDRNTNDINIFLNIETLIPTLTSKYDERGLLGLAFHPEYSTNTINHGKYYIYYSRIGDGKAFYNCLSNFISPDLETSDLNSETILFKISKNENGHNGGCIEFGIDGYLYVSIGDGGIQKDPEGRSQNLLSPFGKLLRIDINDPPTYGIPLDNPFINDNALPEIYAYGFRNPWRFSFDSKGKLFLGDVGYESREEVDIVVKGGNYGWNIKEGTKLTGFQKFDKKENLIDPIIEYNHEGLEKGKVAIIGGYYLDNIGYVFGDFGGLIMIYQKFYGNWEFVNKFKIDGYIRSLGRDAVGNIYVLTTDDKGLEGYTGKVSMIKFIK